MERLHCRETEAETDGEKLANYSAGIRETSDDQRKNDERATREGLVWVCCRTETTADDLNGELKKRQEVDD
jgi:hypothetical protein